jgi:hypothetical protein
MTCTTSRATWDWSGPASADGTGLAITHRARQFAALRRSSIPCCGSGPHCVRTLRLWHSARNHGPRLPDPYPPPPAGRSACVRIDEPTRSASSICCTSPATSPARRSLYAGPPRSAAHFVKLRLGAKLLGRMLPYRPSWGWRPKNRLRQIVSALRSYMSSSKIRN